MQVSPPSHAFYTIITTVHGHRRYGPGSSSTPPAQGVYPSTAEVPSPRHPGTGRPHHQQPTDAPESSPRANREAAGKVIARHAPLSTPPPTGDWP